MSLPAKYLSFYTLQRQKAGQEMKPRDWYTEGYDAAMRHFYANETRQPDRRIPRECDCVDPYRCKQRLQEGFELMGESHV
jgi:hypothetical protein